MKEYPIWSPSNETDWEQIHETIFPLGVGIVNYDGSPIPMVIVPLSEKNIYPLGSKVASTVVFDLVNVSPHPCPIFYAIFVVFNDPEDPLWMIRTIPVTKFYLDSYLPSHQQCWDEVIRIDPNFALSFCNEHQKCALLVLDEYERVIFNEIASVQTPHVISSENEQRVSEIDEMLCFLSDHPAKLKLTQFVGVSDKLHSDLCTFLLNPKGIGITIPRGRNLVKSGRDIFSFVLDNNRAVRREHIRERDKGDFAIITHDVFISYAHSDQDLVTKLYQWFKSNWPKLKIFVTEPNNHAAFEQDPMYFIAASRKSRAIIHVATPNSIRRPMSHAEIGLNADKPIFSLIYGWTESDSFKDWLEGNIFISIPRKKTDQRETVLDMFPALANEKFIRKLQSIDSGEEKNREWIRPFIEVVKSRIRSMPK